MTTRTFTGAIALAAALCLPLLALSSITARADRAEFPAVRRIVNFNTDGASIQRNTAVRKSRRHSSHAARGRNPAIVALVKAHARAAGVPVSTALAIVQQESGFRPHVTGSAGEIGLMQLKCQTARGIGFKGSCKALYDPGTNLRYGMRYLKAALRRGSVAYYNAGIHARSLPKAAHKYAAQVAAKGS